MPPLSKYVGNSLHKQEHYSREIVREAYIIKRDEQMSPIERARHQEEKAKFIRYRLIRNTVDPTNSYSPGPWIWKRR